MGYGKYLLALLNPYKSFYLGKQSLKDAVGINNKPQSNEIHLRQAMNWLSRAQKINKDGGVSALYSLFHGWSFSYVETTGYIIPTFLNYAKITKNNRFKKEAIEMADFELQNQFSSGAFPGGDKKEKQVVFNTGQVIFGLCKIYEVTKDQQYKDAVIKAADWLVKVMDKEGRWRTFEYLNHEHVYNTRTAWSLLCAHKITKKPIYKTAAMKNIDWAIKQQHPNGWFTHMGFYPSQEPLVHTIAYTIRGILEAGMYLNNKKYMKAAITAADAVLSKMRKDGSLAGSFDKNWKSSVSWSCLTGNSQMAIIWGKLFSIAKDQKYRRALQKSNHFMKKVHNLNSANPGIRGGVAGAYPLYGWYAPFCYINWGTKFFVDALIIESYPEKYKEIV